VSPTLVPFRSRGSYLGRSLIGLVTISLAILALGSPASAAGFVVNSLAGTHDNTCDAANCTIREAIAAANASPGLDTITFNLPGNAPYLIQPEADIDPITDPVVIDGTSQRGFLPGPGLSATSPTVATPAVVLDGQGTLTNGFLLRPGSGGSTIQGLVLHGFHDAVRVDGSDGNTIAMNHLGTGIFDLGFAGNRSAGVFITNANGTTVGGGTGTAGNLISTNAFGVIVRDANSSKILGNYIGISPDGLSLRGNQSGIVLTGADDTIIGNGTLGALNIISGNRVHGVLMGNSDRVSIRKNYIGVGTDGRSAMGNSGQGVFLVTNNFDAHIGGPAVTDGNTIAHNGRHGVRINALSERNELQNNSIYSNDLLALDLDGDGISRGDPQDEDVGANTVQNFPLIATAIGHDDDLRVAGSLTTTPLTQFRIEVFVSLSADPSGFGEGRYPLGSFSVTTSAAGLAVFDRKIVLGSAQFSEMRTGVVTATATDPLGNTSEYSAARALSGRLTPVSTPTPEPILPPGGAGLAPPGESQFSAIIVRDTFFDATLNHNIPNLEVRSNQIRQANFLNFYNATGGLTRWGHPTSEVFEEVPGVLTQYYQRGVVSWRSLPGNPNVFAFQRVLVWDFIGGGLGNSVDQGVEPQLFSSEPGLVFDAPAWRHRVANTSVEGIPVGFLDFFNAVGGIESLGFPKTEARRDTHQDVQLRLPGATPGFVRQYFQAGVVEYHPDAPAGHTVQLALLGDWLRDLRYQEASWQEIAAFQPTIPMSVGNNLPGSS
jgi:CSLREA domain-containing protein